MNTHIFSKWFEGVFILNIRKHLVHRGLQPKAVLFVGAPAHPYATTLMSRDEQIKAIFLPPNAMALIQPMDQGVLEAIKRRYKICLLRSLLMAEAEGQSIIQYF